MSRSIKLLAVAVLAIVLTLSSAQNAFALTTLKYDNGNTTSGMSDARTAYYAVKFVLSDFGLSAPLVLLRVRYHMAAPTTQALVLAVFGGADGKTQLASKTTTLAAGWNEWDLTALNLVVSGDFYVAIGIGPTLGYISLDTVAGPHSNYYAYGASSLPDPPSWIKFALASDAHFLIRADVDPATKGTPVGGFMEPVNKLTIAAPYLALVGIIAAVAVVVWKKREN